jgi:hypothetical protein
MALFAPCQQSFLGHVANQLYRPLVENFRSSLPGPRGLALAPEASHLSSVPKRVPRLLNTVSSRIGMAKPESKHIVRTWRTKPH